MLIFDRDNWPKHGGLVLHRRGHDGSRAWYASMDSARAPGTGPAARARPGLTFGVARGLDHHL